MRLRDRLWIVALFLAVASIALAAGGSHTLFDNALAPSGVALKNVQPGLDAKSPFINVRAAPYFAVGDGVADDTAAIQAAYTAGPTGMVYFPCGTYLVSSAISLAPSFSGTSFVGANLSCVTIKATGSMAAVFAFTDITANGAFEFRELSIDGNALAQKGIASTQMRYTRIDRVLIKNTTVAAVDLSSGWDQNITNSFFQNNAGDGLRLGANANNVQVRGNVISTNTGWGILITSGMGVGISNNDISANELGGIYMVSGSGTAVAGLLNVKDNYFEGNAAHAAVGVVTNGSATITGVSAADVAIANAHVGAVITGAGISAPTTTVSSASGSTITMSAPAGVLATGAAQPAYITIGTTLSAAAIVTDIMLNGSSDATLLSNSFPIAVSNIEGNITTSYAATQFVTEDPGVGQTIRIVGNDRAVYSTRSQNLFASVGAAGIPAGMTIEGNQGFASNTGTGRKSLHDRATATPNGGTVSVNLATIAEEFIITPSTGSAYTVGFPTGIIGNNNHPSYQYLVFRIVNSTGGALSGTTWGSGYQLAGAWTDPATGFNRSITFSCDSFTASKCFEVSRTAADVAN